jgi:hypothetical protein
MAETKSDFEKLKTPGNSGSFCLLFIAVVCYHSNIFGSFMRRHLYIFAVILFFSVFWRCGSGKERSQMYSRSEAGYSWRLLSFRDNKGRPSNAMAAHVSVSYATQGDSIFWDSFNNAGDRFFIKAGKHNSSLEHFISRSSAGDSALLLVPVKDFYTREMRLRDIPFFGSGDSVVKIYVKLGAWLTGRQYDSVLVSSWKAEEEMISSLYNNKASHKAAQDENGFYWLSRSRMNESEKVKHGDHLLIDYEGSFLNGRVFEAASGFDLLYGTPGQLLPGLNYVIGSLKIGENAKIILPSRLAFGDSGSSNGTMPPFTPLIYKVSIKAKK